VDAIEIDVTAELLTLPAPGSQESARLGAVLALSSHTPPPERKRMVAAIEDGLILRTLYPKRRR